MAKVASVARRLFRTVASMYSPFSVNAFGRARLLGEIFADENFDRKSDVAFPAGLRLNYGEVMWYNFLRNEWKHFLRENKVFGNIMENRYGCR